MRARNANRCTFPAKLAELHATDKGPQFHGRRLKYGVLVCGGVCVCVLVSLLTLGYGSPLLVLKAGSSRSPRSLAMSSSWSSYQSMCCPVSLSSTAMECPPSSPLPQQTKQKTLNMCLRGGAFPIIIPQSCTLRPVPPLSHPSTRMLVSNTDTTTSLSSRTSLRTFRTASSNSVVLFRSWGGGGGGDITREDRPRFHQ